MPQNRIYETTVTVDFVNAAKDGKQTGSIKANDGNYYRIPAQHIPYFQKGGTYRLGYATKDYNGTEFKFVREVDGHELGEDPLQTSQSAPQGNGAGAAPRQQAAANRAPAASYGDITAKDKLIWVESYVKTFGPTVHGAEKGPDGLTADATVIFDRIIVPWLEGRPVDGPGDRERAVKGGDDPGEPPSWVDDEIPY